MCPSEALSPAAAADKRRKPFAAGGPVSPGQRECLLPPGLCSQRTDWAASVGPLLGASCSQRAQLDSEERPFARRGALQLLAAWGFVIPSPPQALALGSGPTDAEPIRIEVTPKSSLKHQAPSKSLAPFSIPHNTSSGHLPSRCADGRRAGAPRVRAGQAHAAVGSLL